MEEIMNENLVTEEEVEVVETPEVTENVETTTEETPKTYSEEEFEAALNERLNTKLNEILPKRIGRSEAKIRKEFEKKDREYEELMDVLRAGTGKETVKDIKSTFEDFYQKKGIHIASRHRELSDRETQALAKVEAQDIIACGLDVVVEEVERLAELGADGMDKQERYLFKELAEYRQNAERTNELSKLGVTEDVYNGKEFIDFASKFNSNVPLPEIYGYFREKQPKKNIKPMGSMKQAQTEQRDYFTPDEIERLTDEDLDKPGVWEKVRRSMTGR